MRQFLAAAAVRGPFSAESAGWNPPIFSAMDHGDPARWECTWTCRRWFPICMGCHPAPISEIALFGHMCGGIGDVQHAPNSGKLECAVGNRDGMLVCHAPGIAPVTDFESPLAET